MQQVPTFSSLSGMSIIVTFGYAGRTNRIEGRFPQYVVTTITTTAVMDIVRSSARLGDLTF